MVPVLVLTARGSWHERVKGIDDGADDYVTKPFQMEEVLARLRGSHPARQRAAAPLDHLWARDAGSSPGPRDT